MDLRCEVGRGALRCCCGGTWDCGAQQRADGCAARGHLGGARTVRCVGACCLCCGGSSRGAGSQRGLCEHGGLCVIEVGGVRCLRFNALMTSSLTYPRRGKAFGNLRPKAREHATPLPSYHNYSLRTLARNSTWTAKAYAVSFMNPNIQDLRT